MRIPAALIYPITICRAGIRPYLLINEEDGITMNDIISEHPVDKLQHWLTGQVAEYVRRNPDDIRPDVPLSEYGLDSVFALALTGDIEDHLGLTLEPTVMWDYPTLNELSKVLVNNLAQES